tara:strand:- start:441 stop:2663 length:2223 start_codon:yes stop_codon:yes gene_type:complete
MNKTINIEIKGQLAKLLATEDLIIENKQVETAMFNVDTRVLTLPMWDAEENVYDMLVAHEVGHALFTPNKDPRKGIPQTFINVTEDARIEKLMKRKYEGLPKTFYGGYNQLYKDDFFDLAGVDIDDMNLADRINLHFKIGPFMGIKFNEEEQEIVDATANAETFDDAEDAAEMLYNYCKKELAEQEAQEKKEEEEFEAMMKMQGEGIGEDDLNDDVFESYNEDKIEDTDGDGESPIKDGRPDLGEDETEYDEITERVSGNEASGPPEKDDLPDEPQVRTDQALAKAIRDLVNDEAQPNEYIELPDLNLNTVINPNAAVHAHIEEYWRQHEEDRKDYREGYEYLLSDYATVEQAYQKYRKEAQKEVNYLVKEFECKKAADSYARATVSKTGVLDCSKLHTYKYNEDLFKKVTTLADGKNHGLVFILDWSGSMSNCLMDTLKQLYNLVWFCRKVAIPFKVYAFTYEFNRSMQGNGYDLLQHYTPKDGLLAVDDRFSLMEFFTSDSTSKESEHQLLNIWKIAYGMKHYCSYPIPPRINLSGTPLNETIVALNKVLPKFKKETGVQKVQCVILTDGEANHLPKHKLVERRWEDTPYLGTNSINAVRDHLRNRKNGRTYRIKHSWNEFTGTLIEYVKDSNPGINFIGIRLLAPRDAGYFIDRYCGWNSPEALKSKAQWKKTKSFSMELDGYNKYFGLSSATLAQDDEFEVKEDATKAEIKRAFFKSLKTKKLNKKVLGEFVDLIA